MRNLVAPLSPLQKSRKVTRSEWSPSRQCAPWRSGFRIKCGVTFLRILNRRFVKACGSTAGHRRGSIAHLVLPVLKVRVPLSTSTRSFTTGWSRCLLFRSFCEEAQETLGLVPNQIRTKLRLHEAYSCDGQSATAQPLPRTADENKCLQPAEKSTAVMSDLRRARVACHHATVVGVRRVPHAPDS